MGKRRLLYPTPLDELTEGQVELLRSLEGEFDEIVVLVTEAEQGLCEARPRTAGQRIERAARALSASLSRRHYLLPLKRCGLSDVQYFARFRVASPAFEAVLCHDEGQRALCEQAARARAVVVPMPGGASVCSDVHNVRRGLLITRAQPLHVGHEAIVRQMAAEQDEVVVLVAFAQAAFTAQNPATAGERVEMIKPVLERVAPGRHHLVAAPYVHDDGANMAEVAMLSPRFDVLYANNPTAMAMARVEGLPVVHLADGVDVSASEVRRRVVAGLPIAGLVPPEVEAWLRESGVAERMLTLAAPEQRGPGA